MNDNLSVYNSIIMLSNTRKIVVSDDTEITLPILNLTTKIAILVEF